MSTLDLLRRLYCAGVDVGLNAEGGVRLTGNQPPPELLAELKEHRAAVVAELKTHHVGEPDALISGKHRRYVFAPDCLAQNACACLGPCNRFLMSKPCKYGKGREA